MVYFIILPQKSLTDWLYPSEIYQISEKYIENNIINYYNYQAKTKIHNVFTKC